jgi:hypothetical protein
MPTAASVATRAFTALDFAVFVRRVFETMVMVFGPCDGDLRKVEALF